jgi:hypothetical protein
MMSHRIVLLLMVCLAPAALRATVIVPAEFREIVRGADIIAYGRVVSAAADWSDDRKRIDTLVTLQVATYLKGGPGETVAFTVPGGAVGRYRNVLVGAPQFAEGEEAIVFLNTHAGDRPVVFGLNQGVFRVRFDGQTRRRVVMPPALMARGEAPEVIVRGAVERRAVPLETFGAQVQTVLSEAAPKGQR